MRERLPGVRAARLQHGRILRGVDLEDVVVRQEEAHAVVPVAAETILPVARPGVEPDDQTGLGTRDAVRVDVRRRQAAGIRDRLHRAPARGGAPVADDALGQGGGLIAGLEHGRVDRAAVGADGQRARRVAEHRQHGERRSAQRRAEVRGIEDPDVGASDAGRGEVGERRRAVLPAVRRGDEGEASARTGEDQVARLVADQQRADDARLGPAQVDDAHAVGEVIHHPDLRGGPRGDRHRLEPDRDGGAVGEVAGARIDGEHLQAIVRRVDREHARAVRRQRERPDLAALERDEGRGGRGMQEQRERCDDDGPAAADRTSLDEDHHGLTQTFPPGTDEAPSR